MASIHVKGAFRQRQRKPYAWRVTKDGSNPRPAHSPDNTGYTPPPRDGATVWQVVDQPVCDYASGEFLPHGGDELAHLDERAQSRRRRWISAVMASLANGNPAYWLDTVAEHGKGSQARVKPDREVELRELAESMWVAEHAAKPKRAKSGPAAPVKVSAAAHAKLIARMQRYQRKHGRPMPEPMVRAMVAASGLAA